MLFEILALGIPAVIGGGGICATWADNSRFPRPVYGALVSWWYGGFAEDTAASRIAMMIETDHNCTGWSDTDSYGHHSNSTLYNKSLGATVTISRNNGGLSRVQILKKEDKEYRYRDEWVNVPMCAYDDYQLCGAVKRWRKRKKENDRVKKHIEAADLVDRRINENYVQMIEDIEKRILKSTPETAPQLRALLEPPPMPVPEDDTLLKGEIGDDKYKNVDDFKYIGVSQPKKSKVKKLTKKAYMGY